MNATRRRRRRRMTNEHLSQVLSGLRFIDDDDDDDKSHDHMPVKHPRIRSRRVKDDNECRQSHSAEHETRSAQSHNSLCSLHFLLTDQAKHAYDYEHYDDNVDERVAAHTKFFALSRRASAVVNV